MDICSKTELDLIAIDFETIRTLGDNIHDSVFLMMIVPFYAISIRAVGEYRNERLLDLNSDKKITDLRNSIKIYQDRFRKVKVRFQEADNTSDMLFRSMLRFRFLQKWNIHFNLGIYFTKDGKIVGNTQWIETYLNLNRERNEDRNRKSFDTGYVIGCAIQKVYTLYNLPTSMKIIQLGTVPEFGYMDFNTYKSSNIFKGSWEKEVHLAFLHILSLINFEKYVLESVLPGDNEWLFRIKYNVIHYAFSGIDAIFRHCNADNKMAKEEKEIFQELIDDRWQLFSSDFRGCMMHYRLTDKNQKALIKENVYSEEVPFNGLIESVFPGMNFDLYNDKLSKKRDAIESFLEQQFYIDVNKIHTLER